MTLKEFQTYFTSELAGEYPPEEIQSFFWILSDTFLNYSRLDLSLNAASPISEEKKQQFQGVLTRLKRFEPIQYILGQTEFFGLPFRVNEHTLIPRPETEELVSWVISDHKDLTSISVLDIGTGSGCIAISLAKELKRVSVTAFDISEDALAIARQNAVLNKVEVDFSKKDILKASKLPQAYDVIVSNPPYVRQLEKAAMHNNVLMHEPETALYVSNEDPLVFYRAIAQLAQRYLSKGGKLYFEINAYLSEEMRQMLIAEGYKTIEIRKDMFGKDRMIKCSL